MLACVTWRMNERLCFGRAMDLDRAVYLCRKATCRTGVKHLPCHVAGWMVPFIDWTLPDHMNPKWLKFNKYDGIVRKAIFILKKRFHGTGLSYEDFKSTVEFELWRLLDVLDETKSEGEKASFLEHSIVNNCTSLFKEKETDIYNKYQECSINGVMVECPETPESILIHEQEENLQARATHSAFRNMTSMEKKIFSKIQRGCSERTLANQLHVSIQRINKLKQKAVNKITSVMKELV